MMIWYFYLSIYYTFINVKEMYLLTLLAFFVSLILKNRPLVEQVVQEYFTSWRVEKLCLLWSVDRKRGRVLSVTAICSLLCPGPPLLLELIIVVVNTRQSESWGGGRIQFITMLLRVNLMILMMMMIQEMIGVRKCAYDTCVLPTLCCMTKESSKTIVHFGARLRQRSISSE